MKILMDIKIKLSALKFLKKKIGFAKLLKIIFKLEFELLKGEPYKNLPKTKDKKDKESRKLIKEAILIYKLLLKYYSEKEAEDIFRDLVTTAAITQLKCLVPVLKYEEIKAMSSEERKACYCDIINKFPNTEWRLESETEKEIGISVYRCRLVEIFDAVGLSHLRDSCCKGDALFFEKHQPDIGFERNTTIANGKDVCDFKFSVREK
ncbi:MAG: L-2-amino-thiazoline-4-carboxylic acid hydrolase [Christensenellales bacterium]|jgi:hypothetical protein